METEILTLISVFQVVSEEKCRVVLCLLNTVGLICSFASVVSFVLSGILCQAVRYGYET